MRAYLVIVLCLGSASVARATQNSKAECKSGKYAACSDVDIDDTEAKTSYQLGCDHDDGYSCTRLGQYVEIKEKNITQAYQLYHKACQMKDKTGCEFEAAPQEEEKNFADRAARNAAIGKHIVIPPNSIGAVRLTESKGDKYKLEFRLGQEVVRNQRNQRWSPWDEDKDMRSEDVFPIPLKATLEIFDGTGILGEVKVEKLESRKFCENDGGAQWQPMWTADVAKSTLSRPLTTSKNRQRYVALFRIKDAKEPAALSQQSFKKQKEHFPIEGRLKKGGPLVARLDLYVDDEIGDFTAVVWSHQGRSQVECTGP